MAYAPHLTALDTYLATVPGTVSVWCGPAGAASPAYARLEGAGHYACSMMKVAILAALHRAAGAGVLDIDAPISVVNDFASAQPGAPRFILDPDYDQDDAVWALLGRAATLRWLGRRMIVRSSNLAANLALGHVGIPAVADALRLAGATGSRFERGIADGAAREAGLDNAVTARDLARLLESATVQPETRAVLLAQEHREDLAAGLPPGTRVAHKNGWIDGVRHAAGVVFPGDAPPYAISVCTTASSIGREVRADARTLIARIVAASWADRHAIRP